MPRASYWIPDTAVIALGQGTCAKFMGGLFAV
jgi:hypothetical protein